MRNFIISIAFLLNYTIGIAQSPGNVSANLDTWLKIDAGITVTGSGVSTWADQTNSNDFTQGTGAERPHWVDNSINFNASLDFDASNTEFMTLSNYLGFTNNYSTFIVCHGDGANQDILGGASGGNYGFLLETEAAGSLRFLHRIPFVVSGGNNLTSSTTLSTSLPQILSANRATARGTQQYYINGGDNRTTRESNAVFSTNLDMYMGRLVVGTRDLNGKIAEVIVYTSEVTGTDRQKIECYLVIKYGITQNSKHQFYDFAS